MLSVEKYAKETKKCPVRQHEYYGYNGKYILLSCLIKHPLEISLDKMISRSAFGRYA
jgi:hypothetical protein